MAATLLSVAAASAVTLDVRIDGEEWAGLYDRLEIHRSALGEGGPYEELTGGAYDSAFLPVDAGRPSLASPPERELSIAGKSLTFRVGRSAELTVTFVGPDPVSNISAASQISLQGWPYLLAYVDAFGQIVAATVQQGAAALLECLGGDAAPHLGFASSGPLALAAGRDPRLPLSQGKERYLFTDPYSGSSYVYRTRLSSLRTGVAGPFSDPIPASVVAAVPTELLAVGFVKLIDPAGRPLQGQRITVHHDFAGLVAGQYTVAGSEQQAVTDGTGLAEIALLRGLVAHVGIEGTSLARRITVPTDPTVVRFDLLDPAVGSDDLFAVRRQDLPYANRT